MKLYENFIYVNTFMFARQVSGMQQKLPTKMIICYHKADREFKPIWNAQFSKLFTQRDEHEYITHIF